MKKYELLGEDTIQVEILKKEITEINDESESEYTNVFMLETIEKKTQAFT